MGGGGKGIYKQARLSILRIHLVEDSTYKYPHKKVPYGDWVIKTRVSRNLLLTQNRLKAHPPEQSSKNRRLYFH